MKVWRVENALGEGPYTGSSPVEGWQACKDTLLSTHNGSDDHPGWFSDFAYAWESSDWLAGFESEEDLIDWFDGFLNPGILGYGFFIATLEVDSQHVEWSYSGLQIRFNKVGRIGRQGP